MTVITAKKVYIIYKDYEHLDNIVLVTTNLKIAEETVENYNSDNLFSKYYYISKDLWE